MRIFVLVASSLLLASLACEPVKLPHEMPGPVGCGRRDPAATSPGMLSVAQQTTLKNQGVPGGLIDNDKGGKTWIYRRQSGSVFGESETEEQFVFDDRGLLVEQKTELVRHTGK